MPVPDIDLNKWPAARPQLDVESVVMDLFERSFADDADWSRVMVFNEIDVDVDAYANVTDVVIFHCLPPRFASGNHRGAVWTCPLSILVESVDADRAFALASHVRMLVMRWPFMQPGGEGRVLDVPTPPSLLSILVESVDADRAFALASHVRMLVMRWPFMQPGGEGRVLDVPTPPSFAKAAGGKQATSKRVKQYATASDCVITVRDPFE